MDFKVGVIAGDGIGPEITREAQKVLDKVGEVYGHKFNYTPILMGGCSIDVHGVPLTDEAVDACKAGTYHDFHMTPFFIFYTIMTN